MDADIFPTGDTAPSVLLQIRSDDAPSVVLLKLIYEKQYCEYNHLDTIKTVSGLRNIIPKVFPNETYDNTKSLRPLFYRLLEDKSFIRNQFLALSDEMLRMFVADDFNDVLFQMFIQLN